MVEPVLEVEVGVEVRAIACASSTTQDLKPLTAATLIPAESLQGRPSPAPAEASNPAALLRDFHCIAGSCAQATHEN